MSISIKFGEDTVLSTRTAIAPRDVVSITILDHQGPYPRDQLALVGSSSQVQDSKKKFTIMGNFSSVDKDLSMTTASVRGSAYDELGNRTSIQFGTVLLVDGCF